MLIAVDLFSLTIGLVAVAIAALGWSLRHWLTPRLESGHLDTLMVIRIVSGGFLVVGLYSILYAFVIG